MLSGSLIYFVPSQQTHPIDLNIKSSVFFFLFFFLVFILVRGVYIFLVTMSSYGIDLAACWLRVRKENYNDRSGCKVHILHS